MLAYGGTWAKKPTAGMPAAETAISNADRAAEGTRSRPSGPAMLPGPSWPPSDAVAITGTGMVWDTAPGTAPRLIHCSTPSRRARWATSSASSCQRRSGSAPAKISTSRPPMFAWRMASSGQRSSVRRPSSTSSTGLRER